MPPRRRQRVGLRTQLRIIYLFLVRENIHRLVVFVILLLALSTVGFEFFEGISYQNALWWSIVTMTTVGYGDITPASLGGRIIATVVMLLGIGILGLFTATVASIFVERKLKEDRGMGSYDLEHHIILCEWNHRARAILHELRSDRRSERLPIVLIADVETKPVDDSQLFFIQGDVTEENLERANLSRASTVVILGNDRLEPSARDARVVLTVLTVESMNRDVYTIVELVDSANVRHCRRAHTDEIIVVSEFSSQLIARSALDHGVSRVVSELLSARSGSDLLKMAVPESMIGHQFIDVFTDMKRRNNSIVLAVEKGRDGEIISNPPTDHRLDRGDTLILISTGKPSAIE